MAPSESVAFFHFDKNRDFLHSFNFLFVISLKTNSNRFTIYGN